MKYLGGNSMLNKLFKKDFKKVFFSSFFFYILVVGCALLVRIFIELGKSVMFFFYVAEFFKGLEYAFLANAIIQPVIRAIPMFAKNMYGDESYLTHTLPVTKSQLWLSQILANLTNITIGFAAALLSLIIMYMRKGLFSDLDKLLAMAMPNVNISSFALILVVGFLVAIECFTFVIVALYSVVLANKKSDKRVMWGFIYGILIELIIMIVTFILAFAVCAMFGKADMLLQNKEMIDSSILTIALVVAYITQIISFIVIYFLAQKSLKKGVNVD